MPLEQGRRYPLLYLLGYNSLTLTAIKYIAMYMGPEITFDEMF